MELDRILLGVIALLALVCIAVAGVVMITGSRGGGGTPAVMSQAEAGCRASGGSVGEAVCCLSTKDFPSSCTVGACGCSAEDSHAVKVCTCPAGRCFNGTACVPSVRTFEECAAAGYPVLERNPRQCSVPGGPVFTEVAPPPMTAEGCQAARGHWNECGSRCQIDNQGKPAVACPAMCEALCECGGIAGFGCPAGYTCKLPAGIADALGYCEAAG